MRAVRNSQSFVTNILFLDFLLLDDGVLTESFSCSMFCLNCFLEWLKHLRKRSHNTNSPQQPSIMTNYVYVITVIETIYLYRETYFLYANEDKAASPNLHNL